MDSKNRREPTLGESRPASPSESTHAQGAPEQEPTGLEPAIKLALFAGTLLAFVLVGDKLLDRYIQYRAIQALTAELENFEATMQSMSAEQAARIRAERRRRADTSTGKWLAKNCLDWRRSFESMQTVTARDEMRAHCSAYERFLDSGIPPTGAPR